MPRTAAEDAPDEVEDSMPRTPVALAAVEALMPSTPSPVPVLVTENSVLEELSEPL